MNNEPEVAATLDKINSKLGWLLFFVAAAAGVVVFR